MFEINQTEHSEAHRKVDIPADALKKYPHFSVVASEGSVLFIHGQLAHKSLDNVSKNRFRHVLLSTYIKAGVSFNPGARAYRKAINIYE